MRLPIVVLNLGSEESLEHLPEVLQEKVQRLTAAGYLVLKLSQVVAAPDNTLLFHETYRSRSIRKEPE